MKYLTVFIDAIIGKRQDNCNSDCINWEKIENDDCVRDTIRAEWPSSEILSATSNESHLLGA
jgi:hypothetical protein